MDNFPVQKRIEPMKTKTHTITARIDAVTRIPDQYLMASPPAPRAVTSALRGVRLG